MKNETQVSLLFQLFQQFDGSVPVVKDPRPQKHDLPLPRPARLSRLASLQLQLTTNHRRSYKSVDQSRSAT